MYDPDANHQDIANIVTLFNKYLATAGLPDYVLKVLGGGGLRRARWQRGRAFCHRVLRLSKARLQPRFSSDSCIGPQRGTAFNIER